MSEGRRNLVVLVIGLIVGAAAIFVIQSVSRSDPAVVRKPHSLSHPIASPKSQEFSFFLLVSIVQTEHSNLDAFELFYRSSSAASPAADQLKIVSEKVSEIERLTGYRRDFSLALIHLARLLLIPKQAFEERGTQWSGGFDMDSFRTDLQSASNSLRASGSIGQGILKQLDRVSQEIDKDRNKEFSNQEIEEFLSPRLNRFKRPTN